MSDGGFEWTIFEIFEIIISTLLFLTIVVTIFVLPKTSVVETKILTKEIGYITNIVADRDNIMVILNKDNSLNGLSVHINKQQKEIMVSKGAISMSEYYYGQRVDLNQQKNNQIMIMSN